jgi:hypothetical protein
MTFVIWNDWNVSSWVCGVYDLAFGLPPSRAWTLFGIDVWQFTNGAKLNEKEEIVMKKVIACLTVFLMIAGMSVFAALAGDTHHTRSITISEPMIVGGVMVKEGEYRIRFDEVTGVLTVREKDGDLVANTTGEVVQLDDDADVTELTTTYTDIGQVLTEVQMRNVDKILILRCTCVTDTEGP